MTAAGGLEGADPTDLEGLREALGVADPEGKLASIGMSRIEIGTDALSLLPREGDLGPRIEGTSSG